MFSSLVFIYSLDNARANVPWDFTQSFQMWRPWR